MSVPKVSGNNGLCKTHFNLFSDNKHSNNDIDYKI